MKPLKYLLSASLILITIGGNAQQPPKKKTIVIQTNGTCESCQHKIENNIAFEKGVKDVVYDLATSKVTITYNPKKNNESELTTAIKKLGFTAEVCTNTSANDSIRENPSGNHNHNHNHQHHKH